VTQKALDAASIPKGTSLFARRMANLLTRSLGGTNKELMGAKPRERQPNESRAQYDSYLSTFHLEENAKMNKVNANLSMKPRILPQSKPRNDSLDVFLRSSSEFQSSHDYKKVVTQLQNENTLRGLSNISISTSYVREIDLVKVTDRIDNPNLNNEFTVDCVSCHISNIEKNTAISRLSSKIVDTQNLSKLNLARSKDFGSHVTTLFEKNFEKSENDQNEPSKTLFAKSDVFRSGPFVPLATVYTQSRDRSDDMYVTNQFSYYRYSPMISRRVANETSRALSKLVTASLRPNPAPNQCQPTVFDVCESIVNEGVPRVERYLRSDFEYCLQVSKCR
jgi:hypothetical protein